MSTRYTAVIEVKAAVVEDSSSTVASFQGSRRVEATPPRRSTYTVARIVLVAETVDRLVEKITAHAALIEDGGPAEDPTTR